MMIPPSTYYMEQKMEDDKYKRYRSRKADLGFVKVSGYVPSEYRERALNYMKRLRNEAQKKEPAH